MYFMTHGYFNELTLFQRHTQQTPDKYTTGAILSLLLGMLLYGIGDSSWFFSPDLMYTIPPVNDILLYNKHLFPVGIAIYIAWSLFGIALLAQLCI